MKKTIQADIGLLFVAFIWGTTFILVQNAIAFLEPFHFNAIRFGIAAIFLTSWIVCFQQHLIREINMKLVGAGIVLGTWLFSAYALQTFGLLHTTPSKSGFITGLSVILVPFISFLFLKNKIKLPAIIGIFLATIGLYLLSVGENFSLNVGDLLTFLCAIAFAAHIIVTSIYAKYYSPLTLTVIQIITVSLLSALAAFLFTTNENILFHLQEKDVWIALLITAIFATALAFLAQTGFQKYTTPTRVAVIFAMEPVFAAITSFIWLDERLPISALIGCGFIFIGMIFAEIQAKSFFGFMRKKAN